jgi:hypothetical protein
MLSLTQNEIIFKSQSYSNYLNSQLLNGYAPDQNHHTNGWLFAGANYKH